MALGLLLVFDAQDGFVVTVACFVLLGCCGLLFLCFVLVFCLGLSVVWGLWGECVCWVNSVVI